MSDDSVMPRANNAGNCPKGNVTLAMQARAPYAKGDAGQPQYGTLTCNCWICTECR
ncbi:hypothetical protein D9M70_423460 [compost metagenome]